MRADGRRAKGLTAIEQAIPHIMPKRVDAQNYVTEYVDEEIIKEYIRTVRREKGVRLTRMAVVIAAYYLAALQHPYVNRFVMNSRIYDRNHFCVSFVMLKKRADGTPDETTVKVFMTPEDDIFSINQRINDIIEKNSEPKHNNNTDKFARFMFSLPVLPYLVMALVRLMDRCGLLPRAPSTPACSSRTWPPSTPPISSTTSMSLAPPASFSAWASPSPTTSPGNWTRSSCPSAWSWTSASAPATITPSLTRVSSGF